MSPVLTIAFGIVLGFLLLFLFLWLISILVYFIFGSNAVSSASDTVRQTWGSLTPV